MSASSNSAWFIPRIWLAWLAVWYSAWVTILTVGGLWATMAAHWPIALAMALGSYVAGSTPMGGGTIGFPVLVLLFDQPGAMGRDFGFAIQSIGMTSASIFVLGRRQPIAWRLLGWAMLGSLVGTPLGLYFIAPHVPDLVTKLTFAVIWCSFGIMTLYKVFEFARYQGMEKLPATLERTAGLLIGLFGGGVMASVTGVGIDMLIYTVLLLLARSDLKIAIPTSVILMAYTSLLGIAFQSLLGRVNPEVFPNWLAAAPVVALGAPLGVFIVNLISRTPTLLFVALLCIVQFIWTGYDERISAMTWLYAIGAVLVCNILFHLGYIFSGRLIQMWRSAESKSAASAEQREMAPDVA